MFHGVLGLSNLNHLLVYESLFREDAHIVLEPIDGKYHVSEIISIAA